jgi:hypothetical protein
MRRSLITASLSTAGMHFAARGWIERPQLRDSCKPAQKGPRSLLPGPLSRGYPFANYLSDVLMFENAVFS